ncbi:MAG: glycoside hydrolase family 5 protein, partial [Butyrivibrio sp.]|nr:glycoside hydrolase family 5 protein [Butyrivibrio sp.]
GISLGNSLDSTNSGIIRVEQPWKWETAWKNPKLTEELVDALVDAGFTTIRIPVSWTDHLAPEPDYLIVESWMDRVQEVVDYAYDRGVYVILNLHHEDWNYPYYDNQEKACEIMRAVWGQIAERFKDYDEHLIFEGQNEPRKVGTSLEWSGGDEEGWDVVNATNKAFIETIRSSGGSNPYRMLMIPDYAANSAVALEHLEVPEDDDRIIVSVHAYTPYNFALNANGTAEWNNDTREIDELMTRLKTLFTDKGIPVIIGEFGAVNKDNTEQRAQWLKYYMSAAKEIGVPCFWWDNGYFNLDGENLGFIDRRTYEIKFPELLEAMKEVYPD